MRTLALTLLVALTAIAGCLSSDDGEPTVDTVIGSIDLAAIAALNNLSADPMVFEESIVDAAVAVTNDLYEPTMEVSDSGAIFVTAHTIGVDTTGAPAYGSWDDGATWSSLPFFDTLTYPDDRLGGTPPPTDEMFFQAGDDGWLYAVDVTAATFPVNAWSDDGHTHSYYNPNGYDEEQVALQADQCLAAPAKDRPWAAYSNGALLMVSNPAAGPVQIGILDVPSGPLGLTEAPVGIGALEGGGRWNVCAGVGYHSADNSIPGIPGIREDGLFAVPQIGYGYLNVITGYKQNIFALDNTPVFPFSTGGEITSVYGIAQFDHDGTLFVGISNNTAADANDTRVGQLHFAVSTDDGATFQDRTFVASTTGHGVRHFYMDGNRFGPGAFVIFAVDGDGSEEGQPQRYDWYAAHLQVDSDGFPALENVYQIIDEGKMPSAHVTGAAVGPDGRGYTAMYEGGVVSVYIQQGGPTLPTTAETA